MYEPTPKEERSTRLYIATIALLISLPLLIGAIYDAIYPEAAKVDGNFTNSYEQFKLETYERLTDRDVAVSGLYDEEKIRQIYDRIAANHWKLVAHQTRSHLLMYGAPFLVSLAYLLYEWGAWRKKSRRDSEARQSELQ
jgi:hypothetical protein